MANEVAFLERLQRLFALQPRCVLSPATDPSAIDALLVDFPVIIRHEGAWKLFYTAYDGQTWRIAVASSENLVDWQRGEALGTEALASGVAAPWVLRHNDLDEPIAKLRRGMFWMAYVRVDQTNEHWGSLELAFSSDLERWSPFDANPILTPQSGDAWEHAGLSVPCLIERQHLFWLFYLGRNGLPSLGVALSTDFLVWSRDMENPLVQFSPNFLMGRPFFVRQGQQWWLLVSDGQGLRFALSEDLRRWRVLEEVSLTHPDLQKPASPYLFLHDQQLWLFFSAEREGKRHIFCLCEEGA